VIGAIIPMAIYSLVSGSEALVRCFDGQGVGSSTAFVIQGIGAISGACWKGFDVGFVGLV
jgi:hypothetical protein